jgi:hypothetical protein
VVSKKKKSIRADSNFWFSFWFKIQVPLPQLHVALDVMLCKRNFVSTDLFSAKMSVDYTICFIAFCNFTSVVISLPKSCLLNLTLVLLLFYVFLFFTVRIFLPHIHITLVFGVENFMSYLHAIQYNAT